MVSPELSGTDAEARGPALARHFDFGSAYLVTLGEERSEALEAEGRTVHVSTPKGRIVTVDLTHPDGD